VLIVVVVAVGTFLSGGGGEKRLSESSPEWKQMVEAEYAPFIGDGITSITCQEGLALLIDLDSTVSAEEYENIARGWAAKFSRFKQEKLGVSHVIVIVGVNGKVVCRANGGSGRCEGFNWG